MKAHSMRLFPKGKGADKYRLTGIASRCDWVILSDYQPPQTHHVYRTGAAHPETVFLSMRNPTAALKFFAESILPRIEKPFVLVSGSEDVTLPTQIDRRWPQFDATTRAFVREISESPLILHWFAENLDAIFAPNVSPIPTGLVPANDNPDEALHSPIVPPIRERPLRILCSHRVRIGPQWEPRRLVTQLAETDWAAFTRSIVQEVPEDEYLALVAQHSFVLCVEGGGLDPSPKAWQSLQYGAIPIIRRTATSRAYADLPCVYVDEWSGDQISLPRLESWRERWAWWFDDPESRANVFKRLGLDYQWSKILARVPDRQRVGA